MPNWSIHFQQQRTEDKKEQLKTSTPHVIEAGNAKMELTKKSKNTRAHARHRKQMGRLRVRIFVGHNQRQEHGKGKSRTRNCWRGHWKRLPGPDAFSEMGAINLAESWSYGSLAWFLRRGFRCWSSRGRGHRHSPPSLISEMGFNLGTIVYGFLSPSSKRCRSLRATHHFLFGKFWSPVRLLFFLVAN